MSEKWVCDTCLVSNDVGEKTCSCCGTVNLKPGKTEYHPTTEFHKVKEQKVSSYSDDKYRVRPKYSPSDLRHTTVFVVGSSEVDQLPKSCLDQSRKPGTNELLQLYECSLPTPLLSLPKVRINLVSCGALHTALVTSTGVVYTFGCNDMGALGRKPNNDPNLGPLDSEPFQVDLKFPVKKTTCGDNHTLFLTYTGKVFFCGGFKDTDGPIGVADYFSYETLTRLDFFDQPVKVPCEVDGSTIVSDISSGENHCVLLCQGGHSMYTFGSNEFSQLLVWENDQVQNYTENDVDLTVEDNKKLLLTWPQHRTLMEVLKHNNNESENPEGTPGETSQRTRGRKRGRTNEEMINQVFTGNCTTFFQTKSLRLYGAGRNAQGEVGVGAEDLVIKRPRELVFFRGVELTYLSGGQFFSMALVNNYVFTWGQLDYLGLRHEYPHKLSSRTLNSVKDEYAEDYESEGKNGGGEFLGLKKRKLDETGTELDSLDAMERMLNVDYEKKHKVALASGKSTSPILLHLGEPVQTVFHGPDSLFAVGMSGHLYSWGSAQNFILANGRDVFYQKTPEIVEPDHFSLCKVAQGAGGSQHTVFLGVKKRTGMTSHLY